MKNILLSVLVSALVIIASCGKENFNSDVKIPDFNFPKTVDFEDSLSSYGIFEGLASNLNPSEDFHLLELSSMLFTDYSYKQRLIKIPAGSQLSSAADDLIDFPNGTILTKTFFYYNDERDTTLGKRIIETRLEIKENDLWNVATYIWNESQTEAFLELSGSDTPVSWIDENGIGRSTLYHVPTENECMTCHQRNSVMSPLGPTFRNLNRDVSRNDITINQLEYLQNIGLLEAFAIDGTEQIIDYHDLGFSLELRARAYLDMNCAHCHNPYSWERASEREFDFRYHVPFEETGILYEEEKIERALQDREMPLIGTTILDEEGVSLINEYLDSL
jgi:uncharacterized repeat protein (TIGR03806 family)